MRLPASIRAAYADLFRYDVTTLREEVPAREERRAWKSSSTMIEIEGDDASRRTLLERHDGTVRPDGAPHCSTCVRYSQTTVADRLILSRHPWIGATPGVESRCTSPTHEDDVHHLAWRRRAGTSWLHVTRTETGLRFVTTGTSFADRNPPTVGRSYGTGDFMAWSESPDAPHVVFALLDAIDARGGLQISGARIVADVTFDAIREIANVLAARDESSERACAPRLVGEALPDALARLNANECELDPVLRAVRGEALLRDPTLQGNSRLADDLQAKRYDYLLDLGRHRDAAALAQERAQVVAETQEDERRFWRGWGRASNSSREAEWWETRRLAALSFTDADLTPLIASGSRAAKEIFQQSLRFFSRHNDIGRGRNHEAALWLYRRTSNQDYGAVELDAPFTLPLRFLGPVMAASVGAHRPPDHWEVGCDETELTPEPGWWPLEGRRRWRNLARGSNRYAALTPVLPDREQCTIALEHSGWPSGPGGIVRTTVVGVAQGAEFTVHEMMLQFRRERVQYVPRVLALLRELDQLSVGERLPDGVWPRPTQLAELSERGATRLAERRTQVEAEFAKADAAGLNGARYADPTRLLAFLLDVELRMAGYESR